MNNNIIQEVADSIVETRDFCGNESDAVRQWESDNGRKLSREEKQEAYKLADSIWRESQKAAGVKHILSNEERERVYADLM